MQDLMTHRLILHPLTEAEATAVIRAGVRSPGYPSAANIEAAADFLTIHRFRGNPHPFGTYEIRLRDSGRPVGTAGFNRPLDQDGMTTIRYEVAESAQGLGYATEAARALLKIAHLKGARMIRGSAHRDNVASQKVMEGAGMVFSFADDHERFYSTDWENQAEAPSAESLGSATPGIGTGAAVSTRPRSRQR